MINLAKVAINRPVSICMIILALFVFGITSVLSAPVELIPDIEVPMLVVVTVYPGAAPDDVDGLVTKEIESAVSTLSGVKNITSNSGENISMIMLEFEYGTNMDTAHMDLKDRLDRYANSLPEDANAPTVIEINMDDFMDTITLSATTDQNIDLAYYVEDQIVPEIEKLSGVASVSTTGAQSKYIKVELDSRLLTQYGLTMGGVGQVVSGADFSLPVGNARRADQNVSLHGGVRYSSPAELGTIPITLRSGDIIHLSDIAKIYETVPEKNSISRYNGTETMSIGVKKRQSADTIGVAGDVRKLAEALNAKNSPVKLEIIEDSAEYITSSVNTVIITLAVAILLAMIVLFVFMGTLKGSVIIGASIPISLLTTLILMTTFKFSFNIITLSALIISIGNMVDNSVVVLDSCFAVREEGKGIRDAVIDGTGAVMTSQIAGTLASIVTFLPLGLLQGLSGQMFRQLCFTIVFASIASVLSALLVVPLLFFWLKPEEKKNNPVSFVLNKLHRVYERFLRATFRYKKTVIIFSVALLALSLFVATTLKFTLMPETDEGTISISINLKPGLELGAVNEAIIPLEEMVAAHPDVESYSLRAGSGGTNIMSTGSSTASITVYLKDKRQTETKALVDIWKNETKNLVGYDIKISSASQTSAMMGDSSDIIINLLGTDRKSLEAAADMVEGYMRSNLQLSHISSTATAKDPRAEIIVDPMKASAVGMTPFQVVGSLYSMIGGSDAGSITYSGREYKVRLEFPADRYETMSDINGIVLATPKGDVPLTSLAVIEYTNSPQSISRENGQYQVTVSSDLTINAAEEAKAEALAAIEALDLPAGVSIGENQADKRMVEEFTAILQAILAAMLLMFIVMAMQFESTRFSIVVMLCIPFSIIGAIFLIKVINIPVTMNALMGFLLLFSTVINNGILYIDTASEYQRNGMGAENALVNAGFSRMRPILMTSAVSIIAMLPEAFAIGDGAEMMQGMSIVIIGGLVTSTLLTLLLLPTFYIIFGGDFEKRNQKKNEKKEKREAKALKNGKSKEPQLQA